jgi:two-component system LytT family response regulator
MRTSPRSSTLLLALAASTAIGLAAAGQLAALTRNEAQPISFGRALLIDLPVWWYWGLVTPAVLALGRRIPLRGGALGRAIAVHLGAMAGLIVLHGLTMAAITGPLFPSDGPSSFGATFTGTLLNRVISDVIVYTAILGIGSAVDTARLQAELAGAELQALKMQLHPHFLFNTLNTATILVEENPVAAKEVLGLLADLLRATLDQSGAQEVRLSEELELLETYLAIERTRFGRRPDARGGGRRPRNQARTPWRRTRSSEYQGAARAPVRKRRTTRAHSRRRGAGDSSDGDGTVPARGLRVTKLRVLVADDEPIARRGLKKLLAAEPDVEVVGEARDGREAVTAIRHLKPDLVLLDVQMPELDGIGVVRELDGRDLPGIVFVTAYDRYAIAAFDLHAVDYVLKPVQAKRFSTALERARQRLERERPADLVDRIERLLSDSGRG